MDDFSEAEHQLIAVLREAPVGTIVTISIADSVIGGNSIAQRRIDHRRICQDDRTAS